MNGSTLSTHGTLAPLALLLVLIGCLPGCFRGVGPEDLSSDGDADGDSDVDGDIDGDVDGDIDGDVDGDSDADGDDDSDVDAESDVDADSGADADGTGDCTPGGDPFVICDCDGLVVMAADLAGNYALGRDIDCSSGALSVPIGDTEAPFDGTFDGGGHSITGFAMTAVTAGLFGSIGSAGVVSGLALENIGVTGSCTAGGLASANSGTVEDVYVTGTITAIAPASCTVGGLVGINDGTIRRTYSTVTITSTPAIAGGLVGVNRGDISSSFSTASVAGHTAPGPRGGLVADHATGTVLDNGWYDVPGDGADYCYLSYCDDGCTLYPAPSSFYAPTLELYSTWDFTTVWQGNEAAAALPTLQERP